MVVQRRQAARLGATAFLWIMAAGVGPAFAQTGEERAVATAVDALTKAMVEIDRARLDALTSDKLSYGHSAGRIENKAQFIDYLVSRASAFRFINLSDQTVSIVDDEAIVRHLFTAETVSPAGEVTPVRIGVLQIWQKQGNDWRLLARQAYRL